MPQLIGYLTASEARHFHDCATACGVGASTLANLLISRELTLRRLTTLKAAQLPARTRASDAKIVGHLPSHERKAQFCEHAQACGLKPSAAAALLFRAELEEHWLLQSIGR